MDKKRPEWNVRLYPSNLQGVEGTLVRVVQRGTLTFDDLAELLEERTGSYRADTTRSILSMLADLAEEKLLDGYAISGELGTLSPSVDGCWDFDRIQPSARAKNSAKVNFKPSPRLKKSLKNPLFHRVDNVRQGPSFNPVARFPVNDRWEYVMEPDAVIYLEGSRLLMNGDDPSCGFYILDAGSDKVCRFFPREEILLNTRGVLMVKLNGELPPGLYHFRVVSQCTTNSHPLTKPLEHISPVPYRIYSPGELPVIIREGKKIV